MLRRFKVIIEPEMEGGYSIHVPALPGCASQGETIEKYIPTISGLAVFLGYTRDGFYKLANRNSDFLYIVEVVKENITAYHEGRLGSGENCTGSKFWLGCNAGYVEKKEEVKEEVKRSKFQVSIG